MTKRVHCRDVGFDCDGVVEAETDAELLQKVVQHAKEAHGLEEVVAKVKSIIKES